VRRTCEKCTIASASLVSSQPTTLAPMVTKSMWPLVDHCLRKPSPTWLLSRRSLMVEWALLRQSLPPGHLRRSLSCVELAVPRRYVRHPVHQPRCFRSAMLRKSARRSHPAQRGCSPACRFETHSDEPHRAASRSGGLWRVFEHGPTVAKEPNHRTAREKRRLQAGAYGWSA
jgi:hypothetical protein